MSLGDILQPLWTAHAKAVGWLDGLPEELEDQGFIGYRELDSGKILAVMPLLFGRARLTLGNGPNSKLQYPWDTEGQFIVSIGYDGGFDEKWDFDTPERAIDAMRNFKVST